MKTTILLIVMFANVAILSSCLSTKQATDTSAPIAEFSYDEYISLKINEVTHFEFEKKDSVWTGKLTYYVPVQGDSLVEDAVYVVDENEFWQEFDLIVNHLKLYELEPQYKIEGWIPNSSQLPRLVYSFEIYDGEKNRSFSYQDPQYDLQTYWESENVLTFVTYITHDLRWKIHSVNIHEDSIIEEMIIEELFF